MVSHGNPVAVLFAVLTVIGIKYGYVSDPGWYVLAYFSAPMFCIALILFRRKSVAKVKPAQRRFSGRRGRYVDGHLWL